MIDRAYEMDMGDMTLIHIAEAFSQAKLDIVNLLVAYGIDVNVRDIEDSTALSTAALHGDIETVKILLAAGADANLKDLCNRKPLWMAVRYNHVEIAKLLLPITTDIDEQVYNGWTVLAAAAKWCNVESVELLLEAGAEIWSREPGPGFLPPEQRMMWYGMDAFSVAIGTQHNDTIVRMILAAGADRPAVEPEFKKWLAVWDRGRVSGIKKLLEWVETSRTELNVTYELEAKRDSISKSIDVIADERKAKLAEEYGLPKPES